MNKKAQPSLESSDQPRAAGLALAHGWPGLIFLLGEGVFRVLGYFAFVLAGICVARKDGFGVFLFDLLLGHLFICTAQVVDKMNDERKRDSSANGEHEPRAMNTKDYKSP